MKTCRTASIVAFGALFGAGAIAACRETAPPPETRAAVATDASAAATMDASAAAPARPPFDVGIADVPVKIKVPACSETAIAVVSGTATALGEKLAAGDVLLVRGSDPIDVSGSGVVVSVTHEKHSVCVIKTAIVRKEVIRVATTPELVWAKGTMRARLQVGAEQADFYLGRLEGTAPVAQHSHPGTWEILATSEAAGTLVVDGKENRLGPRQVFAIPPDAKHEWRPDPGSKLVAVQIYSPPGPEERFKKLAAEARDGGK